MFLEFTSFTLYKQLSFGTNYPPSPFPDTIQIFIKQIIVFENFWVKSQTFIKELYF